MPGWCRKWISRQPKKWPGFDGALNVDITECLGFALLIAPKLFCMYGSLSRNDSFVRKQHDPAGSKPIWFHIRASTSCWPPMLQSSPRRRHTMSSFLWQRSPCPCSNQPRWWWSVTPATASTWLAAWCTVETQLKVWSPSLPAFVSKTSQAHGGCFHALCLCDWHHPATALLQYAYIHVFFFLLCISLFTWFKMHSLAQEMWCQRMWMRQLPPSRPSEPSSSWIGAPLASSAASTINHLLMLGLA